MGEESFCKAKALACLEPGLEGATVVVPCSPESWVGAENEVDRQVGSRLRGAGGQDRLKPDAVFEIPGDLALGIGFAGRGIADGDPLRHWGGEFGSLGFGEERGWDLATFSEFPPGLLNPGVKGIGFVEPGTVLLQASSKNVVLGGESNRSGPGVDRFLEVPLLPLLTIETGPEGAAQPEKASAVFLVLSAGLRKESNGFLPFPCEEGADPRRIREGWRELGGFRVLGALP